MLGRYWLILVCTDGPSVDLWLLIHSDSLDFVRGFAIGRTWGDYRYDPVIIDSEEGLGYALGVDLELLELEL